MDVQTQVIYIACRNESHGQRCDIAKSSSGVVWLESLHHNLINVDVETIRNTLGKIIEDLLSGFLIVDNELVIQLPEETNLYLRCVGWLIWDDSVWRRQSARQRAWNSGRNIGPSRGYRARGRWLEEDA